MDSLVQIKQKCVQYMSLTYINIFMYLRVYTHICVYTHASCGIHICLQAHKGGRHQSDFLVYKNLE